MDDEILACIANENIKYLQSGQISKYIFPMARNQAHRERISHLIVRFFVMTITPDNEVLYLVQKRSKKKRGYPEHFTDSASGHVIYKKKITLEDIKQDAIRELEEEFGIPADKLQYILFYNLFAEKDMFTPELAYIFFGLVDSDVGLHPDPEELEPEGSQFYTKEQLKTLLNHEKLVDYSKEIWEFLLKQDIRKLFEEKEVSPIKKAEIGLFIGRFQPFHNGHLYVIEEILKRCEKIKIGIGSSQLSNTLNDPFTSQERRQFITGTLENKGISAERFEIIEIPDIFNAQKWVDHVIGLVGQVDIIFSNSDWVRTLFINKGYKIAEKLPLKMDELNATRIRELIKNDDEEWKKLIPKKTVDLIEQFSGITKIKDLYKKEII